MPLSFEQDIKPLFRVKDVKAMQMVAGFDLHSYEDVKAHSDDILERISKGTMPCDAPWPQEHVKLFSDWVDAEMPA